MLLMMLEKGMQVDEIIFCDTGMEFPAMYEHIDKVEQYIGREITRLRNPLGFMYYFRDYEKKKESIWTYWDMGGQAPRVDGVLGYLKEMQLKIT